MVTVEKDDKYRASHVYNKNNVLLLKPCVIPETEVTCSHVTSRFPLSVIYLLVRGCFISRFSNNNNIRPNIFRWV